MNILAIDTATECCSVALKTNEDVGQLKEITPSGHSKLVLGMVEALLAKNALPLNEIDLLAVDIGPGSFTGLRIGIGVAQGLAYTANIPTIGISSLQALSIAAFNEEVDFIIPATDARMKQIYWAVFDATTNKEVLPPHVSNPSHLNIDSMPINKDKKIATIGSGWDTYQQELNEVIAENGVQEHMPNQFPEAKHIAEIASGLSKKLYIPAQQLSAAYIRNDIVR